MSVPEQTTTTRKSLSVRTILLILLVVLLTLFCVFNRSITYVWPLGNYPLIVVILLSFALGAGIGWLAKSLMSGRNRAE